MILRTQRTLAVGLLLGAAALVGKTAVAGTIRVEVKNLAFSPATISVRPGDTIEWTNDDFVAHTATARNGQFDVQLAPHATGKTVVKSVGKVAYYCRYHPIMKGEITVAPP